MHIPKIHTAFFTASNVISATGTGSENSCEQSNEDFTEYASEDTCSIDKNNTTLSGEQINNDVDVHITDELPADLAKRYFLKVREENRLTTACTKNIMKTTSQLINTVVSNLKRKVVQSLEESNIVAADLPNFEDSFAETEDFLQSLSTQSILGDSYEIGDEHVV